MPGVGLGTMELQKVNRCIHDLIDEQVVAQPLAPAICAHDGSYTYAELSILSSRVRDTLLQYGARPERNVAILLEKSALNAVAMLAVIRAGGAFVPLNAKHPARRLERLIRETNAVVLISSSSLSETARHLCSNVVMIDRLVHENCNSDSPTLSKSPTPDNAAYIMFTSGSTGKPRGVLVEHSAIATSAVVRGRATGLGPGSRVLQYAAHTFDVSVDETITTLIHGGCVCVPSEADRSAIAPVMELMRVNYALLTPTSARTLDPKDVPGLRTLLVGGELLSEDVNDKWSDKVRLFNVYGPTEASIACVMCERTGMKGAGNVIGTAIGGACWIVDRDDHNRLVPLGSVGELVVGGPILARGYINDPVKTEAAFVSSPAWLVNQGPDFSLRIHKTGDLASLSDTGSITIHGRKDGEIKIRGHRINVGEVEHALLCSPSVQSVVVDFPKSGPCQGKLTAILCRLTGLRSAEASSTCQSCFAEAQGLDDDLLSDLYEHLASLLPLTMIPTKWVRLPHLPRTSSAKTDRKSIRTWLENMDDETHRQIFYAVPKNPGKVASSRVERKLQEVWSEVLNIGMESLRTDQSFVRNGGDSITAMEVRRRAKEDMIEVAIGDILNACNLRELGARATSTQEPFLLRAQDEPGSYFPLSPVQHLYFDVSPDGRDNFRQSVCVALREVFTEEKIRSAIQLLVSNHPMLRARFAKRHGTWSQAITSNVAKSYLFTHHEILEEEDVIRFATANPPEFCIRSGPVFHVTMFTQANGKQALHLSAHHLVIDLVSWRIILHDLEQLLRSEQAPISTLSFQTWCHMQVEHAATLNPRAVLPTSNSPSNLTYWSQEGHQSLNTHGLAVTKTLKLGALHTQEIMGACNDIFRTQPVEIMLGALYTAFNHNFTDRDTPSIFVESHGREPWHPSIDVSRTVGWFTTAYPLHVPSHLAQDLYLAIKSTKEARRTVPANGHPYFACRYLTEQGQKAYGGDTFMEFVFNFSGRYQQLDREDAVLRQMSVVGEENASQDATRLSLFDISVSLEENQLLFIFTYPRDVNHQGRIDDFVRSYKSLLELAAQELPTFNTDYTQEGLVQRTPQVFDIGVNHNLIDVEADVEAIYPTSALQQHMLRCQEQDARYYRVIGTWKIECLKSPFRVDMDRIEQAWQRVVGRHSALRTTFVTAPEDHRFVSVVLKSVVSPITRVTKADTANGLESTRTTSQENGRERLPHHMTLTENEEGSVECRLEFSHAIIDATSRSVILQELVHEYGGELDIADEPQYQDYLAHIKPAAGSINWISIPPCVFPTSVKTSHMVECIASVPIHLDSPTYILQVCKQYGVTISSLMFTVWGLILSKYVNSDEVSFGYVVSDRAADVVGIERAVGLFIDMLVCHIELKPISRIMEVATQIQRECADSISNPTRATETYHNSNNGHSTGLFNTMVNVRNIGANSLHLEANDLHFSLQSFEDPWDYDLTLAVNHTGPEALSCTLDYRVSTVSGKVISSLARDVSRTLDAVVVNPTRTKQSLEALLLN